MKDFPLTLTYDDIQIIPKYSEILSRSHCDIKTRITKKKSLNIPITAAPMDTVCGLDMANELSRIGGLGFLHRFCSIEEQSKMVDSCDATWCGVAVGVSGDWWERTQESLKNGADIILLDVAHGHHIHVKHAIEKIKSNYSDIEVIAGNVCTRDGTKDLCEWGADGIRCNVGNGASCITRINTGVGIPSVTSILDCCEIADLYNVPVIADGGIRYPGDVAKAIGLGAETIMLGSLLAGTRETPGEIQKVGVWPNENLFKKYRGSASLEAKLESGQQGKHVEGVSMIVSYRGKVERIINDILEGLRSSMSYTGALNITEFQCKCDFVRVTPAGIIEATPHGMEAR
jgi:IMP dehydrogenase